MPYTPRQYQRDLIAEARGKFQQGFKRVLIQAPTGSGKTVIMVVMFDRAVQRGNRVWFIVHRVELLRQSVEAFRQQGLDVGIVASGFPMDPEKPIQVASIQTLARRYAKLQRPTFICVDECHHAVAKSWSNILRGYPDAYVVGLTATPERLDGEGLGQHFESIVEGPSVRWLIDNWYLSNYRAYAPSTIDTSGVHTKMGDFAKAELEAASDRPSITGDAVEHYLRLCAGKRALAFCVSVKHSESVCEAFKAAGVPAEHVCGETPSDVREAAMERFKRGETKVLTSVELFGEGVDVPAMEAAILLRPTQSLALHLQQCGRVLRPQEGKTAIILDHAGNCLRHGLPDEERKWSLDSKKGHRKKKGEDTGPSVRICKQCFLAQPSGRPVCEFCGYKFPVEYRKLNHRKGELVELTKVEKKERRMEVGRAETYEDLQRIAKERGYSPGWAWIRWKLKQKRRQI